MSTWVAASTATQSWIRLWERSYWRIDNTALRRLFYYKSGFEPNGILFIGSGRGKKKKMIFIAPFIRQFTKTFYPQPVFYLHNTTFRSSIGEFQAGN